MSQALLDRITELETEVDGIRRELLELRAQAQAAAPQLNRLRGSEPLSPPARETAGIWPPPRPQNRVSGSEPLSPARRRDLGAELRARAARLDRDLSAADLLGAKALAWAGGIVTILGVVFFFILAVDHGWLGPELRVAFGGAASLAVLLGGLELRRRFGESYSSLAAVGAGIAGAYGTLLAATALYGFVPRPLALLAAAAIAGAGTAVALAWESELVAAIGLVGAMVVPGLLAFQGGLSRVGTGFVAVVLAGTAVAAVARRWNRLLAVATAVAALQGLVLAHTSAASPGTVADVAAIWALLLAGGIARQLVEGRPLTRLASGLVLGSGGYAFLGAALLFDGRSEGIALAAAALTVAAACVVLALREATELAELLGVVALALGAVAGADLLSGPTLTYAWAAEGAVLAWVALRLRAAQYQLGALAYLALATGHALVLEARPDRLFEPTAHPAVGAPALTAIGVAFLILASLAREWDEPERKRTGVLRPLADATRALREHRDRLRACALAAGAIALVYAASLTALWLFRLGSPDVEDAFLHGHVALTAGWTLLGVLAVAAATRYESLEAQLGCAAWLGLVAMKAAVFDADRLPHGLAGWTLVATAAGLAAAALLADLLEPAAARLSPLAACAVATALGFALRGSTWLLPEHHGLAVTLVGAAFAAIGLALLPALRLRQLATAFWAPGLVTVAVAEAILFDGTLLATLWAAGAVAALLAAFVAGEPRLRAAAGLWALALTGFALVREAAPEHLLRASAHPAAGALAVVLAVVATAAVALVRPAPRQADAFDEQLDALGLRARGLWLGGVLAVYAGSLGILELAERAAPGGDVTTNFQRGHAGVSAFWGLLGLALLTAGLLRRQRALRIGGFVLFGLILAKIFLYDLAALSSATRAVSFLAVGGVLLLGGFCYQRLSRRLA